MNELISNLKLPQNGAFECQSAELKKEKPLRNLTPLLFTQAQRLHQCRKARGYKTGEVL
jgi:hypothetical protein